MGNLSYEAWQASLSDMGALGDGEEGFTVSELSRHFGVPERSMRKVVNHGVEEGRFKKGHSHRHSATGARYPVTVYQIVATKP